MNTHNHPSKAEPELGTAQPQLVLYFFFFSLPIPVPGLIMVV